MKCLPCGYEAPKDHFGVMTSAGAEWSALTVVFPNRQTHVGAVDVFVCPHCGALHTDARGLIELPERKN